jgi:small subunit ribosomal protein S7
MSRKKTKDTKRFIKQDSVYGSIRISRFINRLMLDGKKSISEKIVYSALEQLAKDTKMTGLEAFEAALKNVSPMMEVRSRRVGGSTYQVPMEVRSERGFALGMRWIIASARKRSGRKMDEKLYGEFIDAVNRTGSSVKKREDTHKMAEANKAFAHFRW